MARRTIAISLLGALLLLSMLAGCSTAATTDAPGETPPAEEPASPDTGDATPDGDAVEPAGSESFDWASVKLTNAVTGETFTLRDFEGTQVYVQAFAVW